METTYHQQSSRLPKSETSMKEEQVLLQVKENLKDESKENLRRLPLNASGQSTAFGNGIVNNEKRIESIVMPDHKEMLEMCKKMQKFSQINNLDDSVAALNIIERDIITNKLKIQQNSLIR